MYSLCYLITLFLNNYTVPVMIVMNAACTFTYSFFIHFRMESAGSIGSRKREGKKYSVEDEALDKIAKEVC